jgi:hypothetical protein
LYERQEEKLQKDHNSVQYAFKEPNNPQSGPVEPFHLNTIFFGAMFLNSVSRLVRPTRGVRFCSTGVDAQYLNTIIVSRKGPIGYITLNRPKNLNALNLEVQNELISSLKQFDADSTIKCVIITGSGDKAFAGGTFTHCVLLTVLSWS